ncbi:MAG TPA: CaiB/BaiF CoA-transferase family protein [Candidatus Nanoarchaeia archaeon]|nr:CaiB/BaiF CoA-transferase family protein [Candidatus Nanoarchaeia archaeon]
MLLKGIKILDLSNLIPGPMCSMILASLGAYVIKIESMQGDPLRNFEKVKGKSPYFEALNRGKKSVAINLKTEEGKKILRKLILNSDVFLESFRPGKMDSLEFGYSEVKKLNPKIIYCSISGYGQTGKDKNKAGHDLNFLSSSGMLAMISDKSFVPGVQIADTSSALFAAISIIASLFSRERSNKGNYVDVSMMSSAISMMAAQVAFASCSSRKQILSGCACYNIYQTKDKKFVSLCAIEPRFWKAFYNATNNQNLIKKQFDSSNSTINSMQKLFKSKNLAYWKSMNSKYDFCCEPVMDIKTALKENQSKKLLERNGIFLLPKIPMGFSNFRTSSNRKSPKIGQHTKKILIELRYSNDKIKTLAIEGVILSSR